MVQRFPEAGDTDPEAEADIDWLKQVLQGTRRIRSELNLAPSLELPVEFQGGGESDRARFAQFEPLLASLARAGSFAWLEGDADTSKSAVALVGDLKVLIPLAGLVDVQSELSRITKQLARERADLERSRAKMGNRRFVENAPEAVVAQERERLAAHEASVESFREQIERLESLGD
jgi:valyl-tRNA synthetase